MKNFKDLKITKSFAAKLITGIAVLCVLCAAAAVLYGSGGIARGVSVNGTDIGGMSVDEAAKALSAEKIPGEQEIVLYTKKGKTSLKASDIVLEYDAERTARRAYETGRTGNPLKRLAERALVYAKGKDMHMVCSYDKDKLAEIIYNFGVEVNGERQSYILEYGGETVTVRKGTPGQSSRIDTALYDFNIAAGRGVYTVYLHLEKEAPSVPDTESLYNDIYIEPRDAYYEVAGNDVVLVPEVVGRQIDKIEAGTKIENLKNGEAVTLKLVRLQPEITVDTLSEKLFNYTLAQYTTSYSSGDTGRKKNVELAAAKINGIILAPKQVFSFNNIVGPRTKAAGFRDAPVFENGATVQGVGGGVCQVSSTLYSAVLYADLKIVSRQNHSMTVAYVPKGQDATVSYGTIDFKFENDTGYPVKVTAEAKNGKLTVSLHGTKPENEKTVKIVNNIIETIEPTVEEKQDTSVPVGTRKVISSGKTGYVVETRRIVTENGAEVKSETVSKSRYKMVPASMSIGAKVPEGLPPLPATPAPVKETSPQENNEENNAENPEESTEASENTENTAENESADGGSETDNPTDGESASSNGE